MYMEQAFELAEKGRGRTHPNPSSAPCSCSDGRWSGAVSHLGLGEPHAEAWRWPRRASWRGARPCTARWSRAATRGSRRRAPTPWPPRAWPGRDRPARPQPAGRRTRASSAARGRRGRRAGRRDVGGARPQQNAPFLKFTPTGCRWSRTRPPSPWTARSPPPGATRAGSAALTAAGPSTSCARRWTPCSWVPAPCAVTIPSSPCASWRAGTRCAWSPHATAGCPRTPRS